MTFQELLFKFNFSKKAYDLTFHLSKKIKNTLDYLTYKNCKIDFSLEEFKLLFEDPKPIERLLKKVYFCNQEFTLIDNVFCPRNETELIIEILEKKHLTGKYIDICAGTGVIGITLLKQHKELQGTLLDISNKAIENININLKKHRINAKVIQEDWFEHLTNNSYQIITANFPYVGKKDPIDKEILKYDPPLALFAELDGWEHYEKMLNWMRNNSEWKIVVLECSSLHEKKWQKIKHSEWKIEFIKDLNNLLRVVLITR
ncbi:release factor glutamine methyltransferase [Candidatus Mycoplasma haematohominis]|uniref:peptide chain release factor N(5)-glutamine methyltransferase n=1 Tax=Candidatus Mycoplasma haematohominis TaxID=1494318 RepID=A0A478FPM3_9MOLU|nr:release factor glutamine methyltransferase [Candidatus Mycoplasma haemohominis]